MSLTIYVGDVSQDLANAALVKDPLALLVTSQNADRAKNGTIYISLGDFETISTFYKILSRADLIVFVPPSDQWSDHKTITDRFSIAWFSAHYVNIVSKQYNIPVENLPAIDTLKADIPVKRHTNSSQFWFAGCSTTRGVGVLTKERYCNLLTDEVKIDFTLIAKDGSSIPWQASEILKSDIRSGDTIIWGLTSVPRFYWYENKQMTHVTTVYYQNHPDFNKTVPIDTIDNEHRLYEAFDSITRVENFCSKVGAKLLLVSIHSDLELSLLLSNRKNFLMIHGTSGINFDSEFLDYGSDNLHPGPKTHKLYKDQILKKLIELKSIPEI